MKKVAMHTEHPEHKHTSEVITAWSSAAVAILALCALIFSMFQIRWQLKDAREETEKQLTEVRGEAKIQHLLEESSKFEQEPLVSARKKLAAKRINRAREKLIVLDDPGDMPSEMWDVLNACDEVGLLTKRNYLDVADVWSQLGYWFFNIYADGEKSIEADRRGSPTSKPNPASMENCSWLIEQMRPLESARNAGTDTQPTDDDLYQFYASESDAEPGKPPSRGPKKK